MNDTPRFMVNILCMTYNHAKYIRETMNGFCIQQTNFPFAAIIVDDASTDGEPDVIKAYLNEHFDMENAHIWENNDAVFIEVHHKENLNCTFVVILLKYNYWQAKKNKWQLYEGWMNTRYIAICEGDDYWTHKEKLQKQIDYLEDNGDCSLCVHASNWEKDGAIYKNDRRFEVESDIDMPDLIINGGDFLPTHSFVYRYVKNETIPRFRKIARVGDYPLVLHLGLNGKVHYLPEIMGVYRYMVPGSWTENHKKTRIKDCFFNEAVWMEEFDKESNFKYRWAIRYKLFLNARFLFWENEIPVKDYLSAMDKINIWDFMRLRKNEKMCLCKERLYYKYRRLNLTICALNSLTKYLAKQVKTFRKN